MGSVGLVAVGQGLGGALLGVGHRGHAVEPGRVQQAGDGRAGAVDGDVPTHLTGTADATDEGTEAGGVEEGDAREVDEQLRRPTDLGERLPELGNGERVELAHRSTHGVSVADVDVDLEHWTSRGWKRRSSVPVRPNRIRRDAALRLHRHEYHRAVADVLIASDSPAVIDDIDSALGGPDAHVRIVRAGIDVLPAALARLPDLVVLDQQIGNMGGVASCLNLRLEESADRIDHTPVLVLLDRRADVFLARRSGAEGWIMKPLDPIRLRKAAMALLGGGTYHDETGRPRDVASAGAGAADPVG